MLLSLQGIRQFIILAQVTTLTTYVACDPPNGHKQVLGTAEDVQIWKPDPD